MNSNALPTCFTFVQRDNNRAVDFALVEAFPLLEPHAREAALRTVIKRGDIPAQIKLLESLDQFDADALHLVALNAAKLSPMLRRALNGYTRNHRLHAVRIIAEGRDPKLGAILAEGLVSRDKQTKAAAGNALADLINHWLAAPSEQSPDDASEHRHLADAAIRAVQSWDSHRNRKLLQSLLCLSGTVMPEVVRKIGKLRSRFNDDLVDLIEKDLQPRHAAFALQALTISELRVPAATAISNLSSLRHAEELLRAAFLLLDREISDAFRLVVDLACIKHFDELLETHPHLAPDAVNLVHHCGMPDERKARIMQRWIDHPKPFMSEAVLWHLIRHPGSPNANLLQLYGYRKKGRMMRLVRKELRHRRGEHFVSQAGETSSRRDKQAQQFEKLDRFWRCYDELDKQTRLSVFEGIEISTQSLDAFLKRKLAASDAWQRNRAMHMASTTGAAQRLREQVFRMAHDHDPTIRANAVNLLAEFPGTTCERILKQATADPDDRVRANAIEVLDRLGIECRADVTIDSLNAKNHRVRANAVRSLLRLQIEQAGEALLDMLEDESADHRISGLWVVADLGLTSLSARLETIMNGDVDPKVREEARQAWTAITTGAAAERTSHD